MSSLPTEARPAGETTLVDVTMPQMGVSVAEGTVVAWAKQIGDRVQADETICEISTDKIDTEVPAPVTGIVAEVLVGVDATVDVGVVLARIAADEARHYGVRALPIPTDVADAKAVDAAAERVERELGPILGGRPGARRRAAWPSRRARP